MNAVHISGCAWVSIWPRRAPIFCNALTDEGKSARPCEPGVCHRQTHTLSGLKLLRSLVVIVCQSKKIDLISTRMTTTGNELALSRFLALIDDKELRDKVEEVARFYWSSSNVTVNLLPALAATLFVIGGIMLLLWLVGFDMGGSGHSGSGSGYGVAASNKAYTYDDTIADLQAQVYLHLVHVLVSLSLYLILQVAALQENAATDGYGNYGGYDAYSPEAKSTDSVGYAA